MSDSLAAGLIPLDPPYGRLQGAAKRRGISLEAKRRGPAATSLRASALSPSVLLIVLMVAFVGWFAAYSIALHAAHLTHKADLGQIDQAIWNTAHGRLLQEVVGERVSTRLTDHAEPIFLPLSLLFWLWDDVRALLVFQALALALGALPVFLLARSRVRGLGYGTGAEWAGLALATCYLLAPALQEAAVSEFHAFALAPPLVAWALWAVERRQWLRFILAALLLIAVQEGLALLGALLGLYGLFRALAGPGPGKRATGLLSGAFVLLTGLAWFYLATFIIIPHFAAQAYGIQQTPYAARYGQLGDSFGDVLKSLALRPGLVLGILREPLRLRYLAGLLASTGFLALLAPEILALSLPLLLANVLSAFPFQYAGELHYSAPLVPYFALAAGVGLARLLSLASWARRAAQRAGPSWARLPALACRLRTAALAALLALLLVSALAWQAMAGYTPLGREYRLRVPGGWPVATAHDRLLARFLAQVPAAAPGSASADLFPHLAHRALLYEFPALGRATWALVDVAGTTDRHPRDIRNTVDRLLQSGWGVVDAADGYILLAAGAGSPAIAPAFYDFARAPGARPQHPLAITFGDRLRLLGYDVAEDAKWRRTTLRYYWQALSPLPTDTAITLQILAPDGAVANDSALRPLPSLVWYPPAAWQVGETVVTAADPWYLPAAWAPLVAVKAGGTVLAGAGCAVTGDCLADGRVVLAAENASASLALPTNARAQFQGPDWHVTLAAAAWPRQVAPGAAVALALAWSGEDGRSPGPAGRDYTVFVHLRGADGSTVANADAAPTWFVARPTSQWPTADLPWTQPDLHTLRLPANLAPGRYKIVIGWYDWQSGARLPVVAGTGNPGGDEFVLGDIRVDPAAARRPDLACLVAAEACASQ